MEIQNNTLASSTIIEFWFDAQNKVLWFSKNPEFDNLIKTKFLHFYEQALLGKLDHWKESPEGILALIIVFDQFPRNIFRNTAKSFATDERALNLAKPAIENSIDKKLVSDEYRHFLYMPFMHSEVLSDQEKSLQLFKHNEYAQRHYDIIRRFGRFPHRNNLLNRISTAEELEFLKQPDSSF